jgi:hypothetical protein
MFYRIEGDGAELQGLPGRGAYRLRLTIRINSDLILVPRNLLNSCGLIEIHHHAYAGS